MMRRVLLALLGVLLLGALGYGAMRLMSSSTLGDLQRDGPAAVVRSAQGEPQLWVIGKRPEAGPGVRRGGWRGGRVHHLELSGYDTVTGELRLTRRLRSLDDDEGGHGAQARILGPDGERVWLFVHDQPVAVAAADGAVRATLPDIAAANPGLGDLLPRKLDEYLFDEGLVFIAADGRRLRIAGDGLVATPYEPRSVDDFNQRRFMAGRWHGSYETRRFLTPQSRTPQRWIGLYTDEEAREAGNDGFGDNMKQPDRTWRDDRLARRGLWTAAIGRTREFSEGSHERLLPPLKRLAQSADYLQGGFLRDAGRPAPLLLEGAGLLVLHRTRIDEAGRALLSRVDIAGDLQPRVRWDAALPFTEMHSRWQFPDRLLMIGQSQQDDGDRGRRTAEHLAIVDLRDGRVRTRDLFRAAAGEASGADASGAAGR
jgi:hypothetical protein